MTSLLVRYEAVLSYSTLVGRSLPLHFILHIALASYERVLIAISVLSCGAFLSCLHSSERSKFATHILALLFRTR